MFQHISQLKRNYGKNLELQKSIKCYLWQYAEVKRRKIKNYSVYAKMTQKQKNYLLLSLSILESINNLRIFLPILQSTTFFDNLF